MPYQPPPELASLSLPEIADLVKARKLPPVGDWQPERVSDSFMRIDAAGNWFHKGGPITRKAMVRVFSTILRREDDGSYALVTPFERQTIKVEDAPFIAVEMTSEGRGEKRKLAFRLNTDDLIVAGPDNLIRFEKRDNEWRPYLDVRNGLAARIDRNIYYELVNLILNENETLDGKIGLWSNGQFIAFPMEES